MISGVRPIRFLRCKLIVFAVESVRLTFALFIFSIGRISVEAEGDKVLGMNIGGFGFNKISNSISSSCFNDSITSSALSVWLTVIELNGISARLNILADVELMIEGVDGFTSTWDEQAGVESIIEGFKDVVYTVEELGGRISVAGESA